MSKATEAKLSELHGKLAGVLVTTLDNYEKEGLVYASFSTEEIVEKELSAPKISAPILAVAAKFLADNSITVEIGSNEQMTALETRLANSAAKREKRRSLDNVEFVDFSRDVA